MDLNFCNVLETLRASEPALSPPPPGAVGGRGTCQVRPSRMSFIHRSFRPHRTPSSLLPRQRPVHRRPSVKG